MFRYGIKGWVFATTFYTVYHATKALCQLYPGKTNAIMVFGIFLNIAINYAVLKFFEGNEGP